ncbi:hypothetical protein CB1_000490044 [Camelus ferus]|nr:hypothetical protein CB1_000490044 [Camelus ferus]
MSSSPPLTAHFPVLFVAPPPQHPGRGLTRAVLPPAAATRLVCCCQVTVVSVPEPGASLTKKRDKNLGLGWAEAELPLQREELESSQSEPSPSAKQHKKAKKRKSLGTPVLPVVASTVPAPSEILGLERKARRLRPLYQYINYCNPELNQAGEGDREAEAEVEPESELTLVPEEAGVEQLQALLPMAVRTTDKLTKPRNQAFAGPAHQHNYAETLDSSALRSVPAPSAVAGGRSLPCL